MATVAWTGGGIRIIDQSRLPDEEVWLVLRSAEEVAEAITSMRVRGAPAIGAAAAMGLALAVSSGRDVDEVAAMLTATRPTAVNLEWAIHRVAGAARSGGATAAVVEAVAIADEDVRVNRALGQMGASLLSDGSHVLTHCNAGALATVDYGTALGVVRAAVASGKRVRVWVGETRPVLQGARLTSWELRRDRIPVTVVADTAVGALVASGRVGCVVVGADRVAANGDVANKIGTYTLAVLATRHRVPFYVAAPTSTIDLATPDGRTIVIEERPADEVRRLRGATVTPDDVEVWNPAFDVTPAELVTAIVTEVGVVTPPFADGLRSAVSRASDARGAVVPLP